MDPIQFAVAIVLYLVLFFGIGFLINMLIKTTWMPGVFLYPLVVIFIVSEPSFFQYFTQPIQSLLHLSQNFSALPFVDYIILTAGFIGALLSGLTIQILRSKGYQMF